MRSSALTWALGYVLLGLAALAAFAVPLWYAWNVTIFSGREEILRDDAQRLTELFRREGVTGLTAYINARVGMQIAGERTLLLTDSAYQPLAGNLKARPQGIPYQGGMHAVMADIAGQPTHTLMVRTTLPGGAATTVTRADASSRCQSPGRDTTAARAADGSLTAVIHVSSSPPGEVGLVLMISHQLSRPHGGIGNVKPIPEGGGGGGVTVKSADTPWAAVALAILAAIALVCGVIAIVAPPAHRALAAHTCPAICARLTTVARLPAPGRRLDCSSSTAPT